MDTPEAPAKRRDIESFGMRVLEHDEEQPCNACVNRNRCAKADIACSDFGHYVRYGMYRRLSRKPTGAIFLRIFSEAA